MNSNIKNKIKNLIWMTREKKIIPIQHVVDDKKRFKDKVAVIIGGSGGIGLAISKTLAESGCKIVLCGTNEEKLKICKKQFEEKTTISVYAFDITNMTELSENIDNIYNIYGDIDILVNSAGVHTENVDFFTMKPNEFDRVMSVNIKSLYFVCQEFAKHMIKKKKLNVYKHILIVSSSRGDEPAWSPYGLSKWAVNGLVKGLAGILLPYGIVVNGIAPGSTATELIGVKEGDGINTLENKVGRLITPDEVAATAKLLVSEAGDMIIGEIIKVSAGRGIIDVR